MKTRMIGKNKEGVQIKFNENEKWKKKQNDKKEGFLNEFKKEEKIGYFNSKWVWFM